MRTKKAAASARLIEIVCRVTIILLLVKSCKGIISLATSTSHRFTGRLDQSIDRRGWGAGRRRKLYSSRNGEEGRGISVGFASRQHSPLSLYTNV